MQPYRRTWCPLTPLGQGDAAARHRHRALASSAEHRTSGAGAWPRGCAPRDGGGRLTREVGAWRSALRWLPASVAVAALGTALARDPGAARGALGQDWPPFVLVSGLLLLGLTARDEGLFERIGDALAARARSPWILFFGAAAIVATVTALLNLDTAVVFVTPVIVAAARRHRTSETPFSYLAVLLANGASLVLPGANLTNLIVIGERGDSGSAFASTMALPWLASIVAITGILALLWRRSLHSARNSARSPERSPTSVHGDHHAGRRADTRDPDDRPWRPRGASIPAIALVVVVVLVAPPGWAAICSAAAGVGAVAWSLRKGQTAMGEVRRTMNLPMLVALFATAADLGALGRAWSGPAHLLAHSSSVVTAIVGALGSVALNNLPAASLFAARPPVHAYALLIGLDLGPNLAVSGALSALVWLQVARSIGAPASARRYSALGLIVVPVSMALALVALGVTA